MEADRDIKAETEPAPAVQLGGTDSSELQRREFIRRFGAYSAGAALGVYILMSPKTGRAEDGGDESTSEGTWGG